MRKNDGAATYSRLRSSTFKRPLLRISACGASILVLASILIVSDAQHVNSDASSCDPEKFFLCASDGACIPRAWLADGEPDCADASDESDEIYAALQKQKPAAAKSAATAKPKENVMVDRDMATSSGPEESHDDVPTNSAKKQTTADTCAPDERDEAQKCAEDVAKWLDELKEKVGSAKPEQISLFRNESMLSLMEHGCALLPAYLSCVNALPAACERETSAKRLASWLSAQTYMCELLIPSVREHHGCFGGGDTTHCKISSKAVDENLACALVLSTLDDIDCVEKTAGANSKCDDLAKELFAPLRSETENTIAELKCRTSSRTSVSAAPSKKIEGAEEPTENETSVQTNSEARPVQPATRTVARKPTAVTTTPTTTTPVGVQTTDDASTSVGGTTTATGKAPKAVAASSEEDAPVSEGGKNGMDLTNALFALANVELICANMDATKRGVVDLWAPIRVKICAHRDAFAKHAKCFKQTMRQTESQCAPQPPKATTCGAIDAFNKQIDCAISALSDLCAIEAQEMVVEIQEKLNDEAIAHKCYAMSDKTVPINPDGFALAPKMERCNETQENTAVTCLVELIEINRQLPQFASLNFLIEISDENSTVVNRICELYDRYDSCLRANVFKNASKKCAFNSPLNTLARIGLSPICASATRQLIVNSRDCLLNIAGEIGAEQCQHGLQGLGGTVEMMLHGIHGEAVLCKSFYMLRNSFDCGENVIRKKCDAQALENIEQVKQKMLEIGLEEGCPAAEPADLDAIIARPPPVTPITPIASATTAAAANSCEAEAQKNFNECIRPLVAFQPHPLAVIKTPKDIDAACSAFETFKRCRASVDCNPIWARGMAAMFEYSCGSGYETYGKVKACVRRVTTRSDIRDCVATFSKSPPAEACRSSNQLIDCALPRISEKCGTEAVDFVREYMLRFTHTVDPDCQLSYDVSAVKTITALNCTPAEVELAERCSRPMQSVNTELERLFQGGFQAFLRNVNNLAPIFAKGCNLTNEFRQCARPVLERAEGNVSTCVLSSCFMRAGDGICDQTNVSEAIDSNLQCVFKQVSVPEFGKCMRSTIATLKQFTLEALRGVLPRFVDCVEPIVLRACGEVPLNVLRALGSRNVCPIRSAASQALAPSLTVVPSPTEPANCTGALAQEFGDCMQPFLVKYDFTPIALLNRPDEKTLCSDLDTLTQCIERNRVCEKPGKGKALRKLVAQICANKHAYDQRAECLQKIVTSEKGAECLKSYNEAASAIDAGTERMNVARMCGALNSSTECLAEEVFEDCPPDTVPFVYDYTNVYWRDLVDVEADAETSATCKLVAPTVSLQTGCQEEEFVNYLKCESFIDKFHFQPISIIRDPSMWEKFCATVQTDYRPCLEALTCKFEPTMSATLSLFEMVCSDSSALGKTQSAIAGCLGEFTKSARGEECLKPFAGVDLLGRDVGERLCTVLDEILNCSAPTLNADCGADAVSHVYALHEAWSRGYNDTCQLNRPTRDELALKPTTDATKTPTTAAAPITVKAPPKRVEVSTTERSTTSTTVAEADDEPVAATVVSLNETPASATEVVSEDAQTTQTEAITTEAATTTPATTTTTTIKLETTPETATITTTQKTESTVTTDEMHTMNPKLRNPATKGNGAPRLGDSCYGASLLFSSLLLLFAGRNLMKF